VRQRTDRRRGKLHKGVVTAFWWPQRPAHAGKTQMHNITQPGINLATANAALITRFVQSPEMVELANTSAQKYLEVAQKSFGRAAASEAYAELVSKMVENYSTFAHEYSEHLMGAVADGQDLLLQQVKKTSDQVAKTSQATVEAVSQAAGHAKARAK
jgi:putative cell wall-binding protein